MTPKPLSLLNSLFDVFMKVVRLQSGDGWGTIAYKDYIELADLFEKYISDKYQKQYKRIHSATLGQIIFTPDGSETSEEAIIITDDACTYNGQDIFIRIGDYVKIIKENND